MIAEDLEEELDEIDIQSSTDQNVSIEHHAGRDSFPQQTEKPPCHQTADSNQTTMHNNQLISRKGESDSTKDKIDLESGRPPIDENQIFVERTYCTVCELEQPLRTKHCKTCKRCVRTFDHHCPWIANCVAEKNHRAFYVFIVLTSCQIVLGICFSLGFMGLNRVPGFLHSSLTVLQLAIEILGFLMSSSLVCFHGYLSSNNITTCKLITC